MSASIYQTTAALETPTSLAITTDLKKDVGMNESDIKVKGDPACLTEKHLEPSSRAHSGSLRRVEGGVFNPAVTQAGAHTAPLLWCMMEACGCAMIKIPVMLATIC